MSKRSKIIFAVIAALLVGAVIFLVYRSLAGRSTELDWSTFVTCADNGQYIDGNGQVKEGQSDENVVKDLKDAKGKVINDGNAVAFEKIQIDGYTLYGYVHADDKNYTYYANGRSYYAENTAVDAWRSYGIIVDFEDPNSGSIWSSLFSTVGILVVCVIFFILINQTAGGGGKVMNFGKTKARVSTNVKVRFSDVAGAEEEKEELKEITEFLKNPQKFSGLGARIPKGVLLVGPPGTGKTLFAKAVAGESGVPFFSVSGSDFVEMYVGVGASRVRDLFDIAKRNQPCIVFIDEIDAVGRERGAGLGGGSDEREQTLNQILVQMDGFEPSEAVIVMAATNRSDVLDPALMRPGRFDRKIMVNLPDVKGREAILKVHARNKPLEPNVNFKTVARITAGFSGADLENLLNEAAILAARENKKLIGNKELYEGINKVIMGPQKKSRVVTEADKRCTAYHESGHAIVAQVCPKCDPVQEVSIIPRGNAAGYTLTRPETDDQDLFKAALEQEICMMLGGRVAEELVIKDVSAGASNDIQRASALARKMVAEWGMSEKIGLVSYGDGQPVFIGKQFGSQQEYSDQTASLIDGEVRRIIEAAHEKAVEILKEHRKVLDNMARVLVERETIYSEEVKMLMDGASVEEVISYMDGLDTSSNDNPFAHYEASFKEDGKVTEEKTEAATEEKSQTEKGSENPENEDK